MVMNELATGIRTEREHRDVLVFINNYARKHGRLPPNNIVYKKIAQAHLREDPKYYTKLVKAKL